MNKSRSALDKKLYNLPNWLWSGTNGLPQFYKMIWEAVREDRPTLGVSQGELLVDTNRVFPLLLTSQLPTEVLGYIWSLANQKYSGQLTELELYIVLALIAVAQTSYPFTNLDVLHMLPGPPTPRLNLSFLYPNQPQMQSGSQGHAQTPTSPRSTSQGKSNPQAGSKTYQVSSLQSPQTSITSNPQTSFSSRTGNSQIPGSHSGSKSYQIAISQSQSIPVQSHQVPAAGSSLQAGARPQNLQIHNSHRTYDSNLQVQSLPGPVQSTQTSIISSTSFPKAQESKLSVSHKSSSDTSSDLSDDFTDFQSAPLPQPSLPNLDPKQGSAIGSRLANHNLSGGSIKKLGEKSKKSALKPKANCSGKEISSDAFGGIFPKCMVKNQTKTVVLKDTVIRNSEPPKTIGTKRESSADQKQSKELSGLDLMNLHSVEDKYSALRILVETPPPTPVEKIQEVPESGSPESLEHEEEQFDDFGDFVSAEQTDLTSGFSQSVLDASMDLFSDFEQFLPNSSGDKEEISFAQETIEALAQLEITASPEKTIDFLEEKYETIMDPEKVIQKEDTISINSIELANGPGVLTRSGSVPSLDLKSFLPSNGDEEKETESMHQLIYWEWKQYMESCILLLQVAVNIFTSINSEAVLQEVLNSAQGYNFLCNLAEVAAVCRRVNFSHKEMDINIMGFDDLLLDIDRIWAEMEPFYVNIPIVTELPVWPLHPGEPNTCALCLTVVTSGRIIYNENTYHATCANLWLNCVNSNLPALKYPLQNHAVSAGGN
ncbi:synergin gamma isoform X2 [Fopius arisanus]|uniref:SYNRG_0 protein n=1 Tax=Fopius arisanus TaxID=64838 RepID=A0A0C9R7K7_9HYME|nr:PREDICTED: synergin gamma-like isoform X2 [Fopius arisanus]